MALQDEGKFVEWIPLQNDIKLKSELVNCSTNNKLIFKFDVEDLKCVKKLSYPPTPPQLVFILKSGTTCPALHFHDGGTSLIISKLENYLPLERTYAGHQDS
ncbi:hypothetical protein HELRODRAFT_181302 [Helobdella robusta]|uniref:Small G protein signalling modulator 1/2 Rab-binding domain-containing protein n=1 Tax=Helobdella robusta TaxID=6412 RepID=T1FGV4_HELRO|nr:hypothetical protein HELRODRAFT_181302 [Helobdella robusta]ESN93185.1 hypothetical protein HELRODRAFT_181302 [Helobdella robusta]